MPSINSILGNSAHEPQVATPLEELIGASSDESVSKALQWADHKTSQYNFQTGGFDKLTDDDVAAILRSAGDLGKLTHQEWDQIKNWMHSNQHRLGDDAKALFARIEKAIDTKLEGPDGKPAEPAPAGGLGSILGGAGRVIDPHNAIMEGPELERFLAGVAFAALDLEKLKGLKPFPSPPKALADGVE